MTDDEWDKQRSRAIMAAFHTGRPVFADTDGELRFVDGGGEKLSDEVGVPKSPVPSACVQMRRAARASLWAARMSIVAAVTNAVLGYWRPWYFAAAIGCVVSAAIWFRVRRGQLTLIGDKS